MPDSSSEYASSTEYLKEYGGLLVDVSTLVDALDHHLPVKSEVRHFSIERVEEALPVPSVVNDAIGEVTSAQISYDTQVASPSITIELFGHESSYRISRSADTEVLTDAVIELPPTDPFTAALLGDQAPSSRPYHAMEYEEFEEKIHNIPGIDTAEFVRLLISLAQPNVALDNSEATNAQLAKTNPFDPYIYQSFIDTSSVTSQLQSAFFEYTFAADDSAEFVFSQENGHPSNFQFACIGLSGETLQIRGTINKAIELDFPRHAVASGLNNDLIDTSQSFPLSLSEIKHIRELLKDEIASIPHDEKIEVELMGQADVLPAQDSIDLSTIDMRIEDENEERAIESRARNDALNDELARLIEEQQDSDD
jgi:hypothetical protein